MSSISSFYCPITFTNNLARSSKSQLGCEINTPVFGWTRLIPNKDSFYAVKLTMHLNFIVL